MRKINYLTICAILLAPILLTMFPSSFATAATPNLITNPSVETENNSKPANWTTNSWGTNTPEFNYASEGHTGNRSLKVTVTGHSSGDAKWMSDQVQVTPGKNYTYTDFSKSDTVTELDAAFTHTSGQMSFVYLKSIPASSGWQQNTATFTVPDGVSSVSIYHIVYSNGWLQTDDFSLTLQGETEPEPENPTDPTIPTDPAPENPTDPTTPTEPSEPATNLITNPSFENADGTNPANWYRGGWGTNSPTLTYLSNDAHTGNKSVNVNISSISSGDAKWYASPTNATAGTYTYNDYYKANTDTGIVVAMTNDSGVDSYQTLARAPIANNWSLYSATFTVPNSIKSVTIYHLLDKAGNLTIDDVSLIAGDGTEPTTPQTNPIANPSFETANGTNPANWQTDKWGTNTASFSYVTNDGHTGNKSSKVTITNYTSGDAKWSFAPLNLTKGGQYNFSAWYKTNTQAHVVATYLDNIGADRYLTLPLPIAGANATTVWQEYSTAFTVPTDATSVTIYFLIASNGWLQTDDFSLTPRTATGFDSPMISLTFDDGFASIYNNGLPLLQKYNLVSTQYLISGRLNTTGYMTTAMAQAFLNSGHEIGSHTITHPDLTGLSASQLTNELNGSKSALNQLFGLNTVLNFASPMGLYNSTVITNIKQYYQSHRSTDVGYNTKDNFNPYNILVQNVEYDTTPEEVAGWVMQAKTNIAWLVLVFHAVASSADGGDEYAITPANLDAELSMIKASGVDVKTVSQALAIINSQL